MIFLPRVGARSRKRRQIGNQAGIPKNQRDGEISADGKNIPDQRTAKLRPQTHRVGIRKKPVKNTRPAKMQQRKHSGAGDGEQRHRLGEAIDGRAPFLMEQQEDRGNKSPRVADADPPDKIDNGKSPRDGNVDSPNADAAIEQPRDGEEKNHQQRERNQRAEPPRCAAAVFVSTMEPIVFRDRFVSFPGDQRRNQWRCSVVSCEFQELGLRNFAR